MSATEVEVNSMFYLSKVVLNTAKILAFGFIIAVLFVSCSFYYVGKLVNEREKEPVKVQEPTALLTDRYIKYVNVNVDLGGEIIEGKLVNVYDKELPPEAQWEARNNALKVTTPELEKYYTSFVTFHLDSWMSSTDTRTIYYHQYQYGSDKIGVLVVMEKGSETPKLFKVYPVNKLITQTV